MASLALDQSERTDYTTALLGFLTDLDTDCKRVRSTAALVQVIRGCLVSHADVILAVFDEDLPPDSDEDVPISDTHAALSVEDSK